MNAYGAWFRRGLRLSVVVGLFWAAKGAYYDFSRYQSDLADNARLRLRYECAANMRPEYLPTPNEYGNINLKGTACADTDFFVSPAELLEVRSGTMQFETVLQPFNLVNSTITAIAAFLTSLLIISALLGCARTAQWIWRGSRAAD